MRLAKLYALPLRLLPHASLTLSAQFVIDADPTMTLQELRIKASIQAGISYESELVTIGDNGRSISEQVDVRPRQERLYEDEEELANDDMCEEEESNAEPLNRTSSSPDSPISSTSPSSALLPNSTPRSSHPTSIKTSPTVRHYNSTPLDEHEFARYVQDRPQPRSSLPGDLGHDDPPLPLQASLPKNVETFKTLPKLSDHLELDFDKLSQSFDKSNWHFMGRYMGEELRHVSTEWTDGVEGWYVEMSLWRDYEFIKALQTPCRQLAVRILFSSNAN